MWTEHACSYLHADDKHSAALKWKNLCYHDDLLVMLWRLLVTAAFSLHFAWTRRILKNWCYLDWWQSDFWAYTFNNYVGDELVSGCYTVIVHACCIGITMTISQAYRNNQIGLCISLYYHMFPFNLRDCEPLIKHRQFLTRRNTLPGAPPLNPPVWKWKCKWHLCCILKVINNWRQGV